MALQIWLPLNKDLSNQGLADLVSAKVQSGVALDDNGKIGKCYTNSGTTVNVATPINFFSPSFSLAGWVKINTKRNNWCRAFGMTGDGTYIGLGCEHTNGTSLGFHYYKTIDGTDTSIFDTYPITVSTGVWNHFVMCYDGIKYYIYQNGLLISSGNANRTNINCNMNTLWLFGGRSGASSQCSLNDVRIYDHCLSAKEVKELSKGLVLHYKLDKINGGPTNYYQSTKNVHILTNGSNLIKDISINGFYWTSSATSTSTRIDNVITTTGSWTISGEAKVSSGIGKLNIDLNDISGTTTVDLTTDYQPINYTINNTKTVDSTFHFVDLNISNIAANTLIYIKDLKIEQGIKASSWSPNPADTAYTYIKYDKEFDCSGYEYDGDIIGNIVSTSNGPKYDSYAHIGANTVKIHANNLTTVGFADSYSFCWWAKTSSKDPMHWGFSNGIRLNGMYQGVLWNTGDSANNPLYEPGTTTQVTAPSTGTWHYYVMTGNGTKCYVYLDGQLWAEAKTYKSISGTSLYINGWDSSTSYSSNNFDISDFRIYATALSADDILELYHTAANIDNHGNIYAGELKEV